MEGKSFDKTFWHPLTSFDRYSIKHDSIADTSANVYSPSICFVS